MPIQSSTQKQLLSAIVYFTVTAALAKIMRWNMVDIAWSIWVSSLILSLIAVTAGNIFFFWLLEIDEHTEEQKASPNYDPLSTEGNVFSSLYMYFVQLVPLVLLNSVVALFLNDILPFPYADEDSETIVIFFAAIKAYWLFIVISLFIPVRDYYEIIKQKMYKQEDTQTDLLLNPYYDVFKVQGLMCVLLVVSSLTSEFLVYWVLLFFYFFPWALLWDWLKALWIARKEKGKNE